MPIPKIIHQTWKEKKVPPHLLGYSESWKKHHPSWDYRLWTDLDNRRLIQTRFPWFLRFYDNYALDIQRADAARIFILYEHGGVYADLDIECLRPIDGLLADEECVFGTEPEAHCRNHEVEKIISNAFMAGVPGHRFYYALQKDLITYTPTTKSATRFVLETTGPFMLNRVYAGYGRTDSITLLPSSYLSPLDYLEAEQYLTHPDPGAYHDRLESAYGIHYYMGTWWKDGR